MAPPLHEEGGEDSDEENRRFRGSSEVCDEANEERSAVDRLSEESSTDRRRASRRAEELRSWRDDRLVRVRLDVKLLLLLSRDRVDEDREGDVTRGSRDAEDRDDGVGD